MSEENPSDYSEEEEEQRPDPFSLDFPVGYYPRRDDSEFFRQKVGAITYKKILIPKTNLFDAVLKPDTEEDAPVIVREPYDPSRASKPMYSNSQYFKNLQTVPDLEFEDKMFSSTIVGWSAETSYPLLINASSIQLQYATQSGEASQDITPMTDTIFPVFVMGNKQLPVTPQVLDRDIMEYEPGNYLVLYDTPGLGSIAIELSVYKHKSLWKFKVNTYRAELELYFLYIRWDESNQHFWREYIKLGKVDRILDKDNASYGVYGMYGGGPQPPPRDRSRKQRICWDQPISGTTSDNYGLRSMESGFRFDIDYQKGSRRVGYYCSRDAILLVIEKPSRVAQKEANERPISQYMSLLKEYTYAIVDGFSSYQFCYGKESPRKIPFKDLDDFPLGPIIVIAPEGVSTLNIVQNWSYPNYRNSRFFNADPEGHPIVINWRKFQTDFNLEPTVQQFVGPTGVTGAPAQQTAPAPVSTGLQQIMTIDQFIDYVVFPIRSLKWELVFVLKQEPNYFPKQKRFDDYWHVFSRLSDRNVAPESRLYYYLGTISNSFFIRYGAFQYNKTHFQHQMFPAQISVTKYPFITQQDMDRAHNMAQQWRNIMPNREFKTVLRQLMSVRVGNLSNASINGHSRDNRIASLEVNVPREGYKTYY